LKPAALAAIQGKPKRTFKSISGTPNKIFF
jgi:hypothetical protein